MIRIKTKGEKKDVNLEGTLCLYAILDGSTVTAGLIGNAQDTQVVSLLEGIQKVAALLEQGDVCYDEYQNN